MSQATLPAAPEAETRETSVGFVERRGEAASAPPVRERRQFANSHEGLSEDAAELAKAIDGYKAKHRRRFISYEEMLSVVKSLGYSR